MTLELEAPFLVSENRRTLGRDSRLSDASIGRVLWRLVPAWETGRSPNTSVCLGGTQTSGLAAVTFDALDEGVGEEYSSNFR